MEQPADTPEFHRARAIELRKLRQFDQALQHIQQALKLRPDYPAGHYNHAAILMDMGQLNESEPIWRNAIAVKPDYWQAYIGLSTTLRQLGRHEEAIAASRKARSLAPRELDPHLSLATALYAARKFAEASAEFEAALNIDPNNVLVLNNYGNALADMDQPARAADQFRRAIHLAPERVEIFNNLANVLKAQGCVDDAIIFFRRMLQKKPQAWQIHTNLLLTLNCTPKADEGLLADHLEWGKRFADPLLPAKLDFPNDRDPRRRLRIGYVSADLRRHSVAYFIEPVIANHHRDQVEVFCYSNAEFTDDFTDRIRSLSDHWRPVFGQNDERVAQMIRDDQIDILVDLNGHTANHRLFVFARKPAPVQVTYLGYPNTTGISSMDYRIGDLESDPPGMTESHYVEKLIRLPHGMWCYQPAPQTPEPRVLSNPGSGEIIFGSFNNFAKATPATLELWAKVLLAVPRSRLLLKAECLSDPQTKQMVHAEFAAHSVDPSRIVTTGREPSFQKHLLIYQKVDIALDTFPYNGTTTTCEALWMGVPVISLAGRAHVSRVGASLLHRVGLGGLVAQNADQFVEIAVRLAGSFEQRQGVSSTQLRRRMEKSGLMNAQSFVTDLEAAYREMWTNWCSRPR